MEQLIDFKALREKQKQLAAQIIVTDQLDKPQPEIIGGADVGFEQGGAITRGVIVVLKFPELKLLEHRIARIKTCMNYRSGLLAFREYPALLAAWEQLSRKPDLLLVDGQGIAHPNRLGLASHFGLLADVPTIGVAKSRLYGQWEKSADTRVAQPLLNNNQQIGWVWHSKKRCNPLFISPGHRVGMTSALDFVQRSTAGYRLPEPTRLADAIASRRYTSLTILYESTAC